MSDQKQDFRCDACMDSGRVCAKPNAVEQGLATKPCPNCREKQDFAGRLLAELVHYPPDLSPMASVVRYGDAVRLHFEIIEKVREETREAIKKAADMACFCPHHQHLCRKSEILALLPKEEGR